VFKQQRIFGFLVSYGYSTIMLKSEDETIESTARTAIHFALHRAEGIEVLIVMLRIENECRHRQ